MSCLPAVTGKQLIGALKRLGFEEIRLRQPSLSASSRWQDQSVVPAHAGETIGRGLLSKVLRDAEISREELGANLYYETNSLFWHPPE